MSVKEKALLYYPKLWKLERLQALVEVGKLTAEDYKEITDMDYEGVIA